MFKKVRLKIFLGSRLGATLTLLSLTACDALPYRIVRTEVFDEMVRERASWHLTALRGDTALCRITVRATPPAELTADESGPPSGGNVASSDSVDPASPVRGFVEMRPPGPDESEMTAWLVGANVRVPRSWRTWRIEAEEFQDFTVLERVAVDAAGHGTLERALVRFTVMDGNGRGLSVDGSLSYHYVLIGDGSGWKSAGFTPTRVERVGRW
ncbi:MAG TPA: hypothetical protein VF584_01430 [Longimicrobium sp.]|jgi:hypothetical protein